MLAGVYTTYHQTAGLSVNNEMERMWMETVMKWGNIPDICLGNLTKP
jgi:hypothetical protein